MSRIGSKGRRNFYRKLSFRMKQGLKSHEAVHSLLKDRLASTASTHEARIKDIAKRRKSPIAIMLQEVEIKLLNTANIGIALEGWVPESDLLILRAGDQAKTLPDTLTELNKINLNLRSVEKKAKMAALQPIGLFVIGVLALIAMSAQIGPMIIDISGDKGLTLAQSTMLSVSNFSQTWYMEIIILAICVISLATGTLHRHWGRFEHIRVRLDRIPPWSLYRKIIGIRFIATLTLMLKNRMMQHAMQEIRDHSKNAWLNYRLDKAIPYVRDGKNLGQALRLSSMEFPDREIVDELVTLSDGDKPEEVVEVIYNEWMENLSEEIDAQATIITRASGLILFVVAVLIMLAMKDTFSGITDGLPM
ncbi:type II secretion system F family protein [Thalassospira xiamenensis]|nr:type II secretion system F family protein [Thalassospira xiamenensis]